MIRGGGGIFYDTLNIEKPAGGARIPWSAWAPAFCLLPGAIVPNPVPGIPGLPAGTPLDIRVPTPFSGSLLNLILPLIRAAATQTIAR